MAKRRQCNKRYCICAFLLIAFSFSNAQIYQLVDTASTINFTIKNFGVSVEGRFKGLKGTIKIDGNTISHTVFDVTIDAATIDTGIAIRDQHLIKDQYFSADKFATIRFVSTKVIGLASPNEAMVTGNITMKKITKEISFPFSYYMNSGTPQFVGVFTINRRDFGVGGSSLTLSDEVRVVLNVSTSK